MTDYQFSGHETFPLRQLWLMKAVKEANTKVDRSLEQSMISLGVGKNMVASIRFWAKATGMLEPKTNIPTEIANLIYGSNELEGLDPFGESLTTAWLAHWNLTKSPKALTSFWFVFNHVNKPSVSLLEIQDTLIDFIESHDCKVSLTSIKRDLEVLLRSYAPNATARSKQNHEEFVEPLLGDLGLILCDTRGSITIRRSDKTTLSNALFAYCLLDFWNDTSAQTSTLDFTKIMHGVGSPGKVFRLTENSIVDRLNTLSELTGGNLLWTEQGGVRTVLRRDEALNSPQTLMMRLLKTAYSK